MLLLVLAAAQPCAMAADRVAINASVGFNDTFRPGHWTPLAVTVTNRGADFSGELEVQVTGDDALRGREFVTIHRRTLELGRDSRKSLHFVVQPQGLSHPLVIRVRAAGQELARADLELRTRFTPQRLVLLLSRDADIDYLNDAAADGLKVVHPHPELLPRHWRGYDAVAAVVVHGVSLERLSPTQFEALQKWIAQGGILAVSGAADYALLRTARPAALLPGVPVGTVALAADALRGAFSASLDTSRTVHVNRLGAFQGQVRLRAGDLPLIVERELGRGRVLYLAFDIAGHPFARWEGMRELMLENLRVPEPANVPAAVPEAGTDTPLVAMIRAAAPDFPGVSTVILFIVLYLGMLFAAYTLPAQGKQPRWLATLCGWAAPVVFVAAAWLLFGPRTSPRGASAAAVALIEPLPRSGYAQLRFEFGVYNTRAGATRLEYRGAEPVLAAHRQARRDGKFEDWVFGEGPRPYVEPLDRRRYVLHALEGEDVIAFHLDAKLDRESTGPRLVLDNASGHTLHDLWLVYGGYAYALGSLDAGARLERQLVAALHGVELGAAPWPDMLRTATGTTSQLAEPTRLMLLRRLQQSGSAGSPGPGHAMLVAHTANPLRPAVDAPELTYHERALVALRIAVTPDDAAAAAARR